MQDSESCGASQAKSMTSRWRRLPASPTPRRSRPPANSSSPSRSSASSRSVTKGGAPQVFFDDPEVAKKLNLTDSQKAAIDEIQHEVTREVRSIYLKSKDGTEASRRLTELRAQTLSKIEGKLNDKQRKILKELLGAPFEIKREPRGT